MNDGKTHFADDDTLAYLAKLGKERDELQALIEMSAPHVFASAQAYHMVDGFRPKRHPIDELVERIKAVLP